ncbi:hypothetical protein H5410_064468 [Solanum commersonii]|uniref:Uncharacterized protein n=1 Tax=Solanum commersonii TaxID=4109 RepID=A0A9J5W010_SOLCO|nr:hypothetical protein H5410_064468 [Solanum commersonii]
MSWFQESIYRQIDFWRRPNYREFENAELLSLFGVPTEPDERKLPRPILKGGDPIESYPNFHRPITKKPTFLRQVYLNMKSNLGNIASHFLLPRFSYISSIEISNASAIRGQLADLDLLNY